MVTQEVILTLLFPLIFVTLGLGNGIPFLSTLGSFDFPLFINNPPFHLFGFENSFSFLMLEVAHLLITQVEILL